MRKNIVEVKKLDARGAKFATALAVVVAAGVFSQSDALAQQPSGAPTVGQTSTAPSAAPITTQTNTTGNTPSSVRNGHAKFGLLGWRKHIEYQHQQHGDWWGETEGSQSAAEAIRHQLTAVENNQFDRQFWKPVRNLFRAGFTQETVAGQSVN